MTRNRPEWVGCALLVCVAVGLPVTMAGKAPAPYDLAVHVIWGDESVGPESLREQVERTIVRSLDEAACYESLHRFGVTAEAEPDLVLEIVIGDLVVREDWDVSIAERTSPDTPPAETDDARAATVEFELVYRLVLWPDDLQLRGRKVHHAKSYRPRRGEDPREAVRALVMVDLSNSAKGFACKGTGKLAREIAKVRTPGD